MRADSRRIRLGQQRAGGGSSGEILCWRSRGNESRAQINNLQQLKGTLIVQDIGVGLLDFFMKLQSTPR